MLITNKTIDKKSAQKFYICEFLLDFFVQFLIGYKYKIQLLYHVRVVKSTDFYIFLPKTTRPIP